MKERSKRGTRLRRMTVVLAIGVAIGTMIMATPASAHFRSSIDHIWSHIKPKADARYANAVAGTDKAKDAALLDGRTAADFDDASALNGRAANGLIRVGFNSTRAEETGWSHVSTSRMVRSSGRSTRA